MDVIDFGFIFFIIISLVILQIVHVRLSIWEQELHIEQSNSFLLSQKNVANKKLMFFFANKWMDIKLKAIKIMMILLYVY